MSNNTTKSKGYYTPGNPKRNRQITRAWFEKILSKSFTDTDIIEKIRSLPDKDVVRLYLDYLPKETKENREVRVTLSVEGLRREKAIMVEAEDIKSLPGNDEDV